MRSFAEQHSDSKRLCSKLFVLAVVLLNGCIRPPAVPVSPAHRQLAEQLLSRGTILLRIGTPPSLAQAEANFSYARELDPLDPRPIDGLGCIAWRRGAFATAEDFFRESLQLDPRYARAQSHVAAALERSKLFGAAGQAHDAALALDPVDYQVRNNRAVHIIQSGALRGATSAAEYETVLQELRKARTVAGKDGAIIEQNIERFSTTTDEFLD